MRTALAVLVLIAAIEPASAVASRTVIGVRGEVRAIAFGGDALVVARRARGRGIVVERVAPGMAARVVLRTGPEDGSRVTLAASPGALAVGLRAAEGETDFARSHVMIGPPLGPLREVGVCAAALDAPPVAAAGARVAWLEGTCYDAATGLSAAALAIAGAEPAAPERRLPIAATQLLRSMVLGAQDTGLAAVELPSETTDTAVRAFGPAGLGATITAQRERVLAPIGILRDGTAVVLESVADDEGTCGSRRIVAVAPATGARTTIPVGRCLIADSYSLAGTGPVATTERIVALDAESAATGSFTRPVDVVSIRPNGADRRVLARGSYRPPLGVAADGDRVAWWQRRCEDDRSEVVIDDGTPAATTPLASCVAEIRTRVARIRAGRIVVRVRCPAGCAGNAFGPRIGGRRFSFGPGSHGLSLRVSIGAARAARVTLSLAVENGPTVRPASIIVRRRP